VGYPKWLIEKMAKEAEGQPPETAKEPEPEPEAEPAPEPEA